MLLLTWDNYLMVVAGRIKLQTGKITFPILHIDLEGALQTHIK